MAAGRATRVAGEPRRELRLAASAGLFGVHEVVGHHVADDHVAIFDAAHVRVGDVDFQLRQAPELAAVAAGEGDGLAARPDWRIRRRAARWASCRSR